MHPARKIEIETAAARSLLNAIAETIGDDDQARMDAVEGETSLLEAIDIALERIRELAAHRDAIKEMIGTLKARSDRFDAGEEYLRGVLQRAMESIAQSKIERPAATLSLRRVPPKVEIVDHGAIPESYLHPPKPRDPDKKAIKAALTGGIAIPGAMLSNGGVCLTITP